MDNIQDSKSTFHYSGREGYCSIHHRGFIGVCPICTTAPTQNPHIQEGKKPAEPIQDPYEKWLHKPGLKPIAAEDNTLTVGHRIGPGDSAGPDIISGDTWSDREGVGKDNTYVAIPEEIEQWAKDIVYQVYHLLPQGNDYFLGLLEGYRKGRSVANVEIEALQKEKSELQSIIDHLHKH